jgi:hypothetical protein
MLEIGSLYGRKLNFRSFGKGQKTEQKEIEIGQSSKPTPDLAGLHPADANLKESKLIRQKR